MTYIWICLITVFTYGNPASFREDGFATEADCKTFGTAVAKRYEINMKEGPQPGASFVCAPKPKGSKT